jgi:hypothetical protein
MKGYKMVLIRQNLNEDRFIQMEARYDGHCAECEEDIVEGDPIVWDIKERKAYCETCGKEYL